MRYFTCRCSTVGGQIPSDFNSAIALAREGALSALPFLECIDFVGELSGVDEASKDVVGEVAESKRDSAEVF